MNKVLPLTAQSEAAELSGVSVVTVLQDTNQRQEKTLLRIVMDGEGQFDVLQYGPANPNRNMTFCFRSPNNPEDVHRVVERDIRDTSEVGILDRMARLMEG